MRRGLTDVDRTIIPSIESKRPMFSDPIFRRECFSGSFLNRTRRRFIISAYSGSSILSCAQALRSRYSRYSSGLSRIVRARSASWAIKSSKSIMIDLEPERATLPRRFLYLCSSSALKDLRKSWKRSSGFWSVVKPSIPVQEASTSNPQWSCSESNTVSAPRTSNPE